MERKWLQFIKAHKSIRLPSGALDLKAISKLYHERGYDLRIRDSRSKLQKLARHLQVEHPSTKGKMRLNDPADLNKPPERWFAAMKAGIDKRSDVRNPYAIVKNIWARLTPAKRAEIRSREAKGEHFKYDLPLPDDRTTRGAGTLRMVKPFKLAEVQVNLSIRDYMDALKSGLFTKMKRQDGTIALVARCKSENKNCNIFIDKV